MDDRRKFVREHADWLADVYVEDTIYTAPVRNLSLGGVELMRPPLWKPKAQHFCKISLSDMVPSHTLQVRMQVCWITEIAVGLKFHELKLKEKVKLNKILSILSKTAAMDGAHFVM
jgi:PilZ domain-containing protein